MTLDEWIVKGKVGVSSKTIWAVMKKIEIIPRKMDSFGQYDIPYDPDDFRRCYLLITLCNLEHRLNEVSKIFPAWKPFVDNWEKLSIMLIQEDNNMYKFMQKLVEKSRLIDSWVKKTPNSWER